MDKRTIAIVHISGGAVYASGLNPEEAARIFIVLLESGHDAVIEGEGVER